MADPERALAARQQARHLQERLVRVAYGLHISAASAAGQLERRATTEDAPARLDFTTEAKRWRVASEQALDIVRVWSPLEPPSPPSLVCPHCGGSVPVDPWLEVIDAISRRLLSLGLTLRTLQPAADPATGRRLAGATDTVQQCLEDVRRAALAMHRASAAPVATDS